MTKPPDGEDEGKWIVTSDLDQPLRNCVASLRPLRLTKAKRWLKERARGTERYGIVVSSQAERLKPHAIDVKSPMNLIHWFLDGPEDVRSSYYLEDVATEFDVQGLELDWACVTWDADFRYTETGGRIGPFAEIGGTTLRNPSEKTIRRTHIAFC